MNEREQMKLDMVKNLAALLMDDNPKLSMEKSLFIVLNSDTYQRLLRDTTHLYYQSPRYVYSFLHNELVSGRVN